jgi:ribosomal protein S21
MGFCPTEYIYEKAYRKRKKEEEAYVRRKEKGLINK